MAVQYDPKVDYSDLIAQEAAKGVNANRSLLAQYEQQRNAKIAGEGITDYGQTNYYQNGYTPPSNSGGNSGSRAPVTNVHESVRRGNSVYVPGYGAITYDDAQTLIDGGYVTIIGHDTSGAPVYAQTTKRQTGPIRLTR